MQNLLKELRHPFSRIYFKELTADKFILHRVRHRAIKNRLTGNTHVLDPSNDPAYNPFIRAHGIACKAIFDCTVPYTMKDEFIRCQFLEVDPVKWVPELFQ